MIVRKEWMKSVHRCSDKVWCYEGWFLFGLIPLYIRRHNAFL